MAELNKIVSQLKNAANELLGQVKDIDSQIAELAKQRDALTSGNVSKDDFLDYLRDHIKMKAGVFGEIINKNLAGKRDFGTLERNLGTKESFLAVMLLKEFSAPVDIMERPIYFYFGDVILERLSKSLDAMDWPKDAIPAALRREHLLNIEQDTAKLYQQRTELVAMLNDAGITGV